jgi:hypothetical protein
MKRTPHRIIHIKRATLTSYFAGPAIDKRPRAKSFADWKYERALAKLARTKPNRLRVGLVRAMTGNPFFFHGAHVGAEND